MGMFDIVVFDMESPGLPLRGRRFQTKNLDCCLDVYTVTKAGRLCMTGSELFVPREHATRLGPTPLVPHELDDAARATLRGLLARHAAATDSPRARRYLDEAGALDRFVRLAVPAPAALATAEASSAAEAAAVPAAVPAASAAARRSALR